MLDLVSNYADKQRVPKAQVICKRHWGSLPCWYGYIGEALLGL